MTFGEKIKQARTAKKLTQKQLAEKINANAISFSIVQGKGRAHFLSRGREV